VQGSGQEYGDIGCPAADQDKTERIMRGKVVSVNISDGKGTPKRPAPRVVVTVHGIEGDAHSGAWHRQISLLSEEAINRFSNELGRQIKPGDFAENITTSGLDLRQIRIRDHLRLGEVEVEVTQLGKKCHGDGCAIFRDTGKCVMPREGIFSRVIKTGSIEPGAVVKHLARPVEILVITLSDRASRGEYEDRSGPKLREFLEKHFLNSPFRANIKGLLLADEADALRETIKTTVGSGVDIIFTTGGTGIGPRDIAPDVILPFLDKEIPGIMEHIRLKYGQSKPSALLSRSVAGMIGATLIFALPGSVKAVEEYMTEILVNLEHCLLMLAGIDAHE